jgi:hypothetical protein
MPKAALYHKKGLEAQALETKLKEAVDGIESGLYKNSRHAGKQLGLSYSTIWRRLKGKSTGRVDGHAGQQLLTPSQEKVLVNWVKWLGFTGLPLSKRTIAPKLEELCGRRPSRNWVYRFVQRHPDCMLRRPARLDAKRARAFNFTTVNKHFEQLQKLFDNEDIPLENLHNFDEIGIQLGGGRKSSGEHFFFGAADR